jgi:hypothetical protein
LKRKIAYVQYTSPLAYTILRTGARIARSRGWDVRFFGVGARGNANNFSLAADEVDSVENLSVPPHGIFLKLHYLRFVLWTTFKLFSFKPDVVYGSEPNAALPLWIARYLIRTRTIYHEHDPPSAEDEESRRLQRALRRISVQIADICIVPGCLRAETFRRQFPTADVRSVWNGVDLAELTTSEGSSVDGLLILWYQGTIVESQLPLALINSLREIPELVLRFAGPSPEFQTDYLTQFLNAAEIAGVGNRVQYLGVVPDRAKLLQHARVAHVGLCLFSTPFRAPMVGASQKVFEYLASG